MAVCVVLRVLTSHVDWLSAEARYLAEIATTSVAFSVILPCSVF